MGMLTIQFCQIGEAIGGLDVLKWLREVFWLNGVVLGKTFSRGLVRVRNTVLQFPGIQQNKFNSRVLDQSSKCECNLSSIMKTQFIRTQEFENSRTQVARIQVSLKRQFKARSLALHAHTF